MQQLRTVFLLAFFAVFAAALAPSSARAQSASGDAAAAKAYGESMQSKFDELPWSDLLKVGGWVVLLALWVGTTDWVNRDTQIFDLGYKKWNPIVYAPVAVVAVAMAFLPLPYVAKLPIVAVVYLATIIPYVVVHNRAVEPHQTVLTGSWFRHIFATAMGKVGVKVKTERLADYEKGSPVELIAMGGESPGDDNVNLLTARQSPGYLIVKDWIVEMVSRRAERMMLDYGQQGVAVRYQVDGVWHPGEARDRESGDVALAVMKTLADLEPKERRKKQTGRLGAKYDGATYMCELAAQGTQSGERVIVHMIFDKARPSTYEELGMREGLQKKWGEFMAADRGLLIFSAMPSGGLTTLIDASLQETDRLMRDFVAIEDANNREHEIQNVNVTTFDAAQGQTAATILPKLIRTYPNVYILRDFTPPEVTKSLINEIQDDRLVITSVQARDAAEALVRMLQLKVPQKAFAAEVTAVLYQRLIRKLCTDCKVGYKPPPDVLKKLGIPPGKIEQLYRPPKPEELEKPCPTCNNIGYVGRTGIFELLEVTDQMREVLAKQPSVDLLRKAARVSHQRSLQEEGILLVAKGVTSLPELMRVLKG
ncbi:MAG: hypothetical protein CMJ58_08810 [Planctomycetaceae bacterium]|nr:hypothetical protein [Planctomycetaceae bacterium]